MKYSVLLLVALCVIIFITQAAVSGFTDNFALVSSDVLSRPWILVTSVFLHGSVEHLAGNMFALALFGFILENMIGTRRFLAIFFASGLASGIAASFFYTSAIGASGAIFGVMGCLAAMRPRMIVWTYGVPLPMFAAAGLWFVIDMLGVFYPSDVASAAHVAGLIFGIAVGLAMRQKIPDEEKEKLVSDDEFNRWEKDWM